MDLFQTFKMAVKSMMSSKGRTILTMLGVIIGVATFITLVALGNGTKKSIDDSIKSMGTNLITISITGRNSNRQITYDQITQYADKNSKDIEAIAPIVSGSVTLKNGDKSWSTTLEGSSPEYETVRNVNIQDGRFIAQADVDFRVNNALVGTAVVNNLFSYGVDPIGQSIKVNGHTFKIVGILQEKASGQNYSQDDKIIVPITVAQRLMNSSQIRTFYVQATSSDNVTAAMNELQKLLLDVYQDDTAFKVQNQADMLSKVSSITGVMTTFLGFIAAISLLVGGIGIMNIMLVTVTERTREIGIRKAIGAKRIHILSQFLVESLVISCIGGIIGILLGILVGYIVSKFSTMTPYVTMSSVILSFSVSAAVGMFFGIYPANKASKLNPIEALRFE